MTSSWPSCRNAAGASLTDTSVAVSPCRSKSNEDKFCVAVAVMVATPSSRSVAGSYRRFNR